MVSQRGSQLIPQTIEEQQQYLSSHVFKAASQLPSSEATEQPKRESIDSPASLPASEHGTSIPPTDDRVSPKPSPSSPSTESPSEPGVHNAAAEPSLSYLTLNDTLRKAATSSNPEEFAELHKDCTMLHILDTGRQPQFMEVARLLLSGPFINLLTFRLTDQFHERYEIEYVPPNGDKTNSLFSSFTLEEVLFQTLSSVSHTAAPSVSKPLQCPSVNPHSVTLLVGTHKDLVTNKDVELIDDTLQKKLKDSSLPKNKIIYYPNPDRKQELKLVVPIDNTSPSDHGVRLLGDLVIEVLDEHFQFTKVPVSWLMFQYGVRSTGRKVLSFHDCAIIARRYGIEDDEELRYALWFLSQQFGVFRYYPDVDDGIVIVDVQVLFDACTYLISCSFRPLKACTDMERRFRKTGRCPIGEAEKLLQCGKDIPPAKLMRLFECHWLLTPVEDKEGQITEYFVPTVLAGFEVESLERPSSHCTEPAPLLLMFSCGFCPLGFFAALVVYLSSQKLRSELKWRLDEGNLFRNKVRFHVGDDLDEVTLIARPTLYEVWIDRKCPRRNPLSLSVVCDKIRSTVYDSIVAVKSSLTTSLRISHQTGFYCQRPDCHKVSHPAVPEGSNSEIAICSFSRLPIRLTPQQLIWFGEVCTLDVIV